LIFHALVLVSLSWTAGLAHAAPRSTMRPRFGDAIVYDLDRHPTRLSSLWSNGRSVMIITASMTCQVIPRSAPLIDKTARRYAGRLPIVVLYTAEAHPSAALDQPRTLTQRLARAHRFQKLYHIASPIYVDGMDDAAARLIGPWPNMAVIVGPDGTTGGTQDWYDLESALDAGFGAP
jgi:hypothetical protein